MIFVILRNAIEGSRLRRGAPIELISTESSPCKHCRSIVERIELNKVEWMVKKVFGEKKIGRGRVKRKNEYLKVAIHTRNHCEATLCHALSAKIAVRNQKLPCEIKNCRAQN